MKFLIDWVPYCQYLKFLTLTGFEARGHMPHKLLSKLKGSKLLFVIWTITRAKFLIGRPLWPELNILGVSFKSGADHSSKLATNSHAMKSLWFWISLKSVASFLQKFLQCRYLTFHWIWYCIGPTVRMAKKHTNIKITNFSMLTLRCCVFKLNRFDLAQIKKSELLIFVTFWVIL
jgi:hypothetical protein